MLALLKAIDQNILLYQPHLTVAESTCDVPKLLERIRFGSNDSVFLALYVLDAVYLLD